MRTALRFPGIALAVIVAAALASCSSEDAPTGTQSQTIATIEISPSSTSFTALTATLQLNAVAKDENGAVVDDGDVEFSWSSSDESVVSVDESGLATALAPGEATVSATAEGVSGNATLTVDPQPWQLGFAVEPTDVESGSTITPAVEVAVQDSLGNRVVGATNVVELSIDPNPSGNALSGDLTVQAQDGLAQFTDLTVSAADDGYRLIASAENLVDATSAPFAVTPVASVSAAEARFMGDVVVNATAGALNGSMNSDDGSSGSSSSAEVNITIDETFACEEGEIEVTGSVSGTLDTETGDGTASAEAVVTPRSCKATSSVLGMNVTLDGDPNIQLTGDAVFESFQLETLTAQMVGAVLWETEDGRSGRCELDVTLEWTPDGGKALEGTVCGHDVATGRTPTQLAFIHQPENTEAGETIAGVVVAIQDDDGFTVLDASAEVTVAIGTNPSGGTLSGTTTVDATSGAAGFGDLSIDQPGEGYTLVADASGLASAESEPFDITSSSGSLAAEEAREVGDEVANAVAWALDQEMNDDGSGSASGSSTEVNRTIDRTFQCEEGQIDVDGSVTGTLDDDGDGTASAEIVVTPESCKATSSVLGTGVTFDGDPNIEVTGDAVFESFAAQTVTARMVGAVLWETEDGRSGRCELDLTLEWTPDGGKALEGMVCGHDVATGRTPTQLAFIHQPENTEAGETIAGVVVAIQDDDGFTVLDASAEVTVAIGTNPSGGTLSGTTTVDATSGAAGFGDLSIDQPGEGYTLVADASGLASAESEPFDITSSSG